MNEQGLIILAVIGIIVILITKVIWQWVLGTDVLISEARKQTKLLKDVLNKIEHEN